MSDLLRPDDARDALRKLGGLVLGVGVLMWLLRKGDDMSDFLRFIILALPGAFLYGMGVFTERQTGGLRPWQAVYAVFGLLFVLLSLNAFVDMVGERGDSSNALNVFWIYGVTAALGLYAGVVAGIRFQLLAGAAALIVAWSALWDKILSGGIAENYGVYRGLLGILAIALLLGALYVWRTDPGAEPSEATGTSPGGDRGLWKASELFTGAGIAAVIACALGILNAVTLIFGAIPAEALEAADANLPGTNLFWDVALLVIALGLVGVGSQIGLRGPVYVGAAGLLLFTLIVGLDLNEDTPHPQDFGAWPLILMILGALGIALSGLKEAGQGDRPRQLVARLRGR